MFAKLGGVNQKIEKLETAVSDCAKLSTHNTFAKQNTFSEGVHIVVPEHDSNYNLILQARADSVENKKVSILLQDNRNASGKRNAAIYIDEDGIVRISADNNIDSGNIITSSSVLYSNIQSSDVTGKYIRMTEKSSKCNFITEQYHLLPNTSIIMMEGGVNVTSTITKDSTEKLFEVASYDTDAYAQLIGAMVFSSNNTVGQLMWQVHQKTKNTFEMAIKNVYTDMVAGYAFSYRLFVCM